MDCLASQRLAGLPERRTSVAALPSKHYREIGNKSRKALDLSGLADIGL
jgi:hypothetical protein